MFNPSRDQARRMFFDTWRKYRAGEPLSGIETLVIDVVLDHPEYHGILERPDRHIDRDYAPEHGETNPFLHMSIHLAITEQLSINQPAGLKERYESLLTQTGDAHAAQHEVMDCLAEMIWQAQRNQTPPDPQLYLACLDGKLHQ
jgi:hypothetical protein